MSVKKFKFVSPGIKVAEIDNSQVDRTPADIGPVIIGRAERGPAMRPVTLQSFSDYIETFGNPIPGGLGGDVWRDGNYSSPTYGAYAAQAWLKNKSPLTYVRLLGAQHSDAGAAGEAGWETKDYAGVSNGLGTLDSDGGAYGLFIIDSGSSASPSMPNTGALAAVWYFNEGSIVLSGTTRNSSTTLSGTAVFIQNTGSSTNEFKAIIRDKNSSVVKTTTFNFDRNSEKYIRKVFNTNPILTNLAVSTGANTASYWLGQTYDRFFQTYVTGTTTYGVIVGLKGNAGTKEACDYRFDMEPAQTGWFFSQDMQIVGGVANSYSSDNMTKLFKFVSLQDGEWVQKNIKISIQDIKSSTNDFDPYGSFSVVLRKVDDSDNAVKVIERFSSCTLNPNSDNYIAKKIGDKYVEWDDTERSYREYGNYDNASRFIRVVMNSDVDAGATEPRLLPFGAYGPPRFIGWSYLSGATAIRSEKYPLVADANTMIKGNGVTVRVPVETATAYLNVGSGSLAQTDYTNFTGSFKFPSLLLRSSSEGGNLANPKDAYFGIDTSISTTSTRVDPGYGDYVYPLPVGFDSFSVTAGETEYSWVFTLDDLSGSGTSHAVYHSGSRAAGTSFTAQASTNYYDVLDRGFSKFTVPLFGAFDGLDITEKEPFNNTDLSGKTELTSYAFNSVKRAIDSVKDPEVVECNLMSAPGITNTGLTAHLISVCEDRADALAVIDLEGGFVPSSENTSGDSAAANRGDVDTTITNLRDRGINSSYACCYYPWVQVKDVINGQSFWCPPSVAAIGTFASSDAKSEIWFAPAGFTRGGLTAGSAGIPVIGVRQKLTSKDRDKLYEAQINPIASFPSEGIVIYGQKTLQVTQSALDRINVRRMLLYVKKEISRMAASMLFDQNIKTTWNRFIGKAKPFLRSVQIRFGLQTGPNGEDGFKLVLDETTTTPDLQDRNTVYAKVYLKPAKSIEFIGIDFVITNSGASFED